VVSRNHGTGRTSCRFECHEFGPTRPPPPNKHVKPACILGTGRDGSNPGTGIWFEGAMTMGAPPNATDDAVQANIVAAGYGH
jgi:hypothetical protein